MHHTHLPRLAWDETLDLPTALVQIFNCAKLPHDFVITFDDHLALGNFHGVGRCMTEGEALSLVGDQNSGWSMAVQTI